MTTEGVPGEEGERQGSQGSEGEGTRCCTGLCRGECVCVCLVRVGATGPGVRVEKWFSGMVPRPAVSASPGSMQILGPYPRHLKPETWGVGPSARSEAVWFSPAPQLTEVKEDMVEEVSEPQGLHLLAEFLPSPV